MSLFLLREKQAFVQICIFVCVCNRMCMCVRDPWVQKYWSVVSTFSTFLQAVCIDKAASQKQVIKNHNEATEKESSFC